MRYSRLCNKPQALRLGFVAFSLLGRCIAIPQGDLPAVQVALRLAGAGGYGRGSQVAEVELQDCEVASVDDAVARPVGTRVVTGVADLAAKGELEDREVRAI